MRKKLLVLLAVLVPVVVLLAFGFTREARSASLN